MTYIDYLDSVARDFCSIIASQPSSTPIYTKDYGWENHRWTSPNFRLGHVEIFNQDRFMVVHCCVFPHITDPSPIFGFDVIAGESKVTGLFWDLSPTVLPSEPFTALPIERPRQRPEWGDIFGEHWIACRPTGEELYAIADDAKRVLTNYLGNLGMTSSNTTEIIAAQDRYCLQQRKNEHTVKAIKNLLGDNLAEEFITTVLFPTVRT